MWKVREDREFASLCGAWVPLGDSPVISRATNPVGYESFRDVLGPLETISFRVMETEPGIFNVMVTRGEVPGAPGKGRLRVNTLEGLRLNPGGPVEEGERFPVELQYCQVRPYTDTRRVSIVAVNRDTPSGTQVLLRFSR